MSTVAEIRAVVRRLPRRQQQTLARWLQAQVGSRGETAQLAKACRGANRLKRVARDMEDWERLNLTES